jgi:MFS family permease
VWKVSADRQTVLAALLQLTFALNLLTKNGIVCRKCGILLNNVLAIVGATLLSSSKQFDRFECLILGRFFLGLNCGLNTALVPMYLSEIAPINLRGALGT